MCVNCEVNLIFFNFCNFFEFTFSIAFKCKVVIEKVGVLNFKCNIYKPNNFFLTIEQCGRTVNLLTKYLSTSIKRWSYRYCYSRTNYYLSIHSLVERELDSNTHSNIHKYHINTKLIPACGIECYTEFYTARFYHK